LFQFLKIGSWPPWAVLNTFPIKPDHSIDCTVELSPNIKSSGTYTLELQAHDGAMTTNWLITVSVTYDPPIIKQGLQDSEVWVGRRIFLQAPKSQNAVRRHEAVVTSPGLPSFGTLNNDGLFTFSPPFSQAPGKFKIQADFTADNNVVTEYFWVEVINLPPFLESDPLNYTFKAGTLHLLDLPKRVDPEQIPIPIINVLTPLSDFITPSNKMFMIFAPSTLSILHVEQIFFTVSDLVHISKAYNFTITILPLPPLPPYLSVLSAYQTVDNFFGENKLY
jgi:hypothetical protein